MRIVEPEVTLEWVTPDPLRVIERAGRVCYKSEDQITDASAAAFVRGILKRGHEAVIEHAAASVRIITDRGITHELVRHRVASFCQESTRYCNYGREKFGNEIAVLEPPGLTPDQHTAWRTGCEAAEQAYFAMLHAGASPQIARSVLPTCLKTELVMTANFREWRHVLSLRLDKAAHPQVIQIARKIRDLLYEACPPAFEEFTDP